MARRLKMAEVTTIRTLHQSGHSNRKIARLVGVHRGTVDGTTVDGDPATMVHWHRYAAVLGAVSTGLWFGAHAIAYYGA